VKKILIIDDDPIFVESLCTLLDSQGYAIITASDGKSGLKKARYEKPALILLDVMMARKTEGYNVAGKLKKDSNTKTIPVILITGIKEASRIPCELKPDEDWLPVTAVLEKPVKPDELLKIVETNIKK